MFQSTHPHGVRRTRGLYLHRHAQFQSTHPHGVRRLGKTGIDITQGFNPRTHMGCDRTGDTQTELCGGFQSTHPHGVRPHTPISSSYRRSFNPRTHMGCDGLKKTGIDITQGFNPRTHMGCDSEWKTRLHFHEVSIHAPTWGATTRGLYLHRHAQFQSTHPHGVRPPKIFTPNISGCFNPRTHMGCDY